MSPLRMRSTLWRKRSRLRLSMGFMPSADAGSRKRCFWCRGGGRMAREGFVGLR